MTPRALVLIGLLGGCAFSGSPGVVPDAGPDGPPEDAMPDTPLLKCPLTYELVAGAPLTSRYRKLDRADPYAKQAAQCAGEGAHLVVIDDAAESAAIDAYATKRNGFFWIGISDSATEATWMTEKNQPATYLPWKLLEPNGGINENCVLQSVAGMWNDFSCGYGFPSVCECD